MIKGAPYFDGPGEWETYRTWVRTKASCERCGRQAMYRAHFYGLKDVHSDDWWLTETDCGCRFRGESD